MKILSIVVFGLLIILNSQSFANLEYNYSSFKQCKNDVLPGADETYKQDWNERCRKAFSEFPNGKTSSKPRFDGTPLINLDEGRIAETWFDGTYELHSKRVISWQTASKILSQWRTSKNYDRNIYTIKKANCSVDVFRQEEIYDNCIIDKLPANANGTLRSSVRKSCSRIACTPGFMDKLKY